MGRGAILLLCLTLPACGARTGLELGGLPTDGGNEDAPEASLDAEAGPDAEAGLDAPSDVSTDAPLRDCPLTPPTMGTTCKSSTTQCAYVDSLVAKPNGLVAWCCLFGGWTGCATKSETDESCTQINCTPGVPVECIVHDGAQCCTCDSPSGVVRQCGPC